MGAIEPIELPETGLIIGTNFPTQDETAYAREAKGQRLAAEHAAGAGGVANDAARYTDQAFRGQAGGSLATMLTGHHQALSADEARHRNVASWLDLGAQNIVQTKTTMNQISTEYHRAYGDMCQRAQAETWPQHLLSNGKDELVAESQNRVRAARAAFEDRHRDVRGGVSSGDAPGGVVPACPARPDEPRKPPPDSWPTVRPGSLPPPGPPAPGPLVPGEIPDVPFLPRTSPPTPGDCLHPPSDPPGVVGSEGTG